MQSPHLREIWRSSLDPWERGRELVRARLRVLVAAALLAIGVAVAGPASPGAAHATLLFTSPAVDGAVPTSPKVVQLVFDQPVVASGSELSLHDREGTSVPLGQTAAGAEPNIVLAPVGVRLPVGEYVVRWQVVARDGDTMAGEFRFGVGSSEGLALSGGGISRTEGVFATSVFRWMMFGGLALALGGLVGGWLAARAGPTSGKVFPRPAARLGSAVGTVAAAGLLLLVVGRGSVLEGFQGFSSLTLVGSTPGVIALLELVAFVAAFAALVAHRAVVAACLLLLVPVGEGLRGHPQASAGDLGVVVIALHVVVAAIWVGALLHVVRVGLRRRRAGMSNLALVRSYARLALVLFLLMLLTGVAAALLVIPTDELVPVLRDTGYGRWLLVKLGLVGVVAVLALWGRWFLRRRPTRAQPGRMARYETAALGAVLAISGVLTALAPPARSDIPLPFPPPAVGPVVELGSRAGYIGIGISASQGQVVVRLTTPDPSPELDSKQGPTHLAGNLLPTGTFEERLDLEFRRCGTGCFVAPVAWPKGESTITLHAEADDWVGGTASVRMAWPPRPGSARLKAVVAAMRKVPHLTLHEQVTSDTTTGLGAIHRLRLSGDQFMDTEPYGSGLASSVTRLFDKNDEVTLAIGFPGSFMLLTVGPDNRLLRETMVSGTHLVTRTFVYDEPESHAGHDHDHDTGD